MNARPSTRPSPADPHAGQPVLHVGPDPTAARGVLVMIHGRGASAESILSLLPELDVQGLAALAPQAAGHTWYPYSFLAPIEQNQPYLDSALRKIDAVVKGLVDAGTPSDRVALLGFSQGACLTSEYVARHPRRYGAVLALTGGLIGPPGTPRNYAGSLDGTPVFLGTSDPDPHIPFERVRETEAVLARLGAKVEVRRYEGMGHTINEDEVEVCRAMLETMVGS
jgi:predicted esterase